MKNDDQFLSTMKWIAIFTIALCLFLAWDADSSESWNNYLKEDIYGSQQIIQRDHIIIDAPYRALDSAGVEIFILNAGAVNHDYNKLTLIIDENPTPCCAVFEFMGIRPALATNVRINAYTDLTVIAEDEMKNLTYNQKYVKAAGGCSAPPVVSSVMDPGTIQVFQNNSQLRVAIFHPNYTGMQFDQLTRAEIPAEYIEKVKLYVDNEHVFSYSGTIGIGQNVFFELPIYASGKSIKVIANDNLGNEFNYDNNIN